MDAQLPLTIRSMMPLGAILLVCSGCVHGLVPHRTHITNNTIPAHRLPAELSAPSKNNNVPIEFTRLRRQPVNDHIIGAYDVLGVYIEDVLADEGTLPLVFYPTSELQTAIESPSVGHPTRVRSDGSIALPLVGDVSVEGLTIPEAVQKIRGLYLDQSILRDTAMVSIDLIRSRTVKVFVVREDTGPPSPSLIRRDTQVYAKRGTTDALDLPIFEADVLHALSASGGLPGADGFNEIWVLRGGELSEAERTTMLSGLQNGTAPDDIAESAPGHFVRIPLRVCPGQEIPFSPADVILHDGDVVFIESRDIEYFMTGGLINGGKYPLPRDHDVDVLEAIAIANTNVYGPAGNATATNFRSGPGNIVAPTRAIVVRQLASGEQIKIEVDLRAAVNDVNERIAIMPRDLIILKYKPHELFTNIALNFVNFGYAIPNN